eukprot:tig00001532_g9268.t1
MAAFATPIAVAASRVAPVATATKLSSSFAGARLRSAPAAVEKAAPVFEVSASIPIIEFAPKTTNTRVAGFGTSTTDSQSEGFIVDYRFGSELDEAVAAAYRQIFGEHNTIAASKQATLESQLKQGTINVREFVKGLICSDFFMDSYFYTNSNYRFVEIVVERVLGRAVYNQAEKIAWSIVIAEKGVEGFVEALTSSEEYIKNFGDYRVPYQRSRRLAGRAIGETPFNLKNPRYSAYYRSKYTNYTNPLARPANYRKKTTGTGADFYDTPFERTWATPVIQKTSRDFEVVAKTVEGEGATAIGLPTNGIPMINFAPSTNNWRVKTIGDRITTDAPKTLNTADQPSAAQLDELIYQAYNQIFNVHHLKYNRQKGLETQIRNGRISVKQFIRGLITSPAFLESTFETNNNYRFVEIVLQRLLGRAAYNEAEKIAWSIVIANKGVEGFVDAVMDSDEYNTNFGDCTVPYQRARVLAGRATGDRPFLLSTPRYSDWYRQRLGFSMFNNVTPRRASPPSFAPKNGDPAQWVESAKRLSIEYQKAPLFLVDSGFLAKVPRRN